MLRPRPRPLDPFELDLVARLAQSRRIRDHDRIAGEVEMHLDHVARGAGALRDDRHVAPRERVHQARLADIGGAEDDEGKPVSQELAAPIVFEMLRNFP